MTVATTEPHAGGDTVELVPDVVEPWLPRLRPLGVAIPVATGAVGIGIFAWATNADRGPVVASLVALLCATLVVLAVVDALTYRLPDAIVLPLYPVLGAGILVAGLAGEVTWRTVLLSVASMAAAFAAYWLIAVFTGGALGYGDVKLAGLLGLIAGLNNGWDVALGALLLPMVLGGLAAFPLLLAGHNRREMPFGPFMAAGALLVLLFPNMVTGWWNPLALA